jgi:hypothetical protein
MSCEKKVFTYEEAMGELANTIRRAMLGEGRRKECRIYECSQHGGWHLTSAPTSSGEIVSRL